MICVAPDSFKSNYNLPMHEMLNTDLGRILKSPRAPRKESHRRVLKKNPLKSLRIMLNLTKPACRSHVPGQAKNQTSRRLGQQTLEEQDVKRSIRQHESSVYPGYLHVVGKERRLAVC
ncbi:hypothetical protein Celaphus_00008132 [Cervus elaphus hippelaphus]|uniref:Large ribosomal subunit protein uL4 C-terminal domain-containing protein n=1 Tax=Cervus elaphus hippelaphus TaxID=46360 RepID=A0A212CN78_CEREH|nr:hypothetical protein Celaphus_00008132 [Cervus elaphus hippelaphus]